jgi:hypothetical protein
MQIKTIIGLKMKKYLLFAVVLLFSTGLCIKAQEKDTLKVKVEELSDALKGLNESYLETKTVVDALKKIKVSGYVQAQYQNSELDGAAGFSGGNFSTGLNNRFMIRRGRIKFVYDNDLTQYVMQFDVTEKGFGTKDMYIALTEPWLRSFSVWGGIFNRPFGYEIEYSSSQRESPERSRLFQTLFPGERDLGAKLEFAPKEGPFSFLNAKVGLFAGNGINVETDNNKDIIGRVGFTLPFYDENISIDGGVSGYFGKVTLPAGKTLYTLNSAAAATADLTTLNVDRSYVGFDLQLYYDLPLIGGFSLKGEYISGKQPGTSSSTTSFTAAPAGDIYLRNFSGYYLMYVQNIGDVNQLVVKYDVYDPNTDVSGNEIGAVSAAKLSAADLKYSTLGLGWIYHWDANIKFVFYYDMVKNETSSKLTGYTDNLKANVFTFRIQYKF